MITNGFNALSRNTNYLGEIMIYSSFNVIAQVQITWYVYYFVWSVIFTSRMLGKDYSNSKKEGWEEYCKKTWMLFPKLFNSAPASFLVYGVSGALGWFTYHNGGIETTLKQLFN